MSISSSQLSTTPLPAKLELKEIAKEGEKFSLLIAFKKYLFYCISVLSKQKVVVQRVSISSALAVRNPPFDSLKLQKLRPENTQTIKKCFKAGD